MPPFDSGPAKQPFKGLCQSFPDDTVYPPADFRVEWGPIFYRGRLDDTARVVVLGQDPAQHEAVVRRVLVGVAGHRIQGFLAKLGIDRSYAIINVFLYSAYNQARAAKHGDDPPLLAYRNLWLDALLVGQQVEAVVALGKLADAAWQDWKATPSGAATNVAYQKITHPTAPRTNADLKKMLQNWNAGLQALAPAIKHPDAVRPLVPYGAGFKKAELVSVPTEDLPPGCPTWMGTERGWAKRTGLTAKKKRATITVTVPDEFLP
jgi:uracil-DNA glycosylase